MTGPNSIRNVFASSRVSVKDTKTLSQLYEENQEFQEEESDYTGSKLLNDKIHVHTGDITNLEVDAIVCSTQTDLSLEPIGICKQVWSVGGERLRDACKVIRQCNAGTAFLTSGYELPANYVIHTAGPPPDSGVSYTERKQCLRQGYLSCLQIVEQRSDIKSLGVPCIGCGGAGIKLETAIKIAVEILREWLTRENNASKIDHIILCMYDNYQREIYCPILRNTFPFPSERKRVHAVSRPKSIASLDEDIQVLSTNIMCYKYKKSKNSSVSKEIEKYMPRLMETLIQTFSYSTVKVMHEEKFSEIDLQKVRHILRMCHCKDIQMVEFRLFNADKDTDCVDHNICSEIANVIENFLVDYFSNITDFKPYVRCQQSYLGEPRRGMFGMDILLRKLGDSNEEIRCEHPIRKFSHNVRPGELLQYWGSSKFCKQGHNSSYRTPKEHDSRSEVPSESSPSLPTCPSLTLHTCPSSSPPTYSSLDMYPSQPQHHIPRQLDETSWTESETESKDKSLTKISSNVSVCNCKQLSGDSSGIPNDKHVHLHENADTSVKQKSGTELLHVHRQRSVEQYSVMSWTNATSTHGQNEKKRGDNNETTMYRDNVTLLVPSVTSQSRDGDEASYINRDEGDRHTILSTDSGASVGSFPSMDENELDFQLLKPNSTCSCDEETFVKIKAVDSVSGYNIDFDSTLVEPMENVDTKLPSNIELSDQKLLSIARKLGNKHKELGIELGLRDHDIQNCQLRGEGNPNMFGLYILKKWRNVSGQEANLNSLYDAMDNCDIDTYDLRNPPR